MEQYLLSLLPNAANMNFNYKIGMISFLRMKVCN